MGDIIGELISTARHDLVVAIKDKEIKVFIGGKEEKDLAFLKMEHHTNDGLKWLVVHRNERSEKND